ncbi:putative glyoxalase [Roseobacter sp. AzwK-3b]|nr:putative glyoxalase [Roseobacter sp. AzwK-3b]
MCVLTLLRQIEIETMKLEFHHINYVSEDVDRLHDFYTNVLGLEDIPIASFPRPKATETSGYDGKIKFATDGSIQFHLATKDLTVAFKNGEVINPVERGHIAFRTDDIQALTALLDENGIPYSDYGTAFAKEWHQVFFHDPEGNVIEVHQAVD